MAGSFSSPDLIIEAALRNDAARGLPPRYATASVTPIQPQPVTDQSRLTDRIGRQHAAMRVLFDALTDQSDIIERLARRNAAGLGVRTINGARTRVLQAEAQLAKVQEELLDSAADLDLLDVNDMGTAMRDALHRLTATDLSAKTDLEEHGLGKVDLVGRRA